MAQLFEVSVKIIQARNLPIDANATSLVAVHIDEIYKYTKSVQFTDSPYFDEYFTFDYKCQLEELLEKPIIFQVKKKKGVLSRITVAEFSLSLREVWLKPGHQIYHQWAPLVHPTKLNAGNQGYLKLDILVLCSGQLAPDPIIRDPEEEDFIERNLIQKGEITLGGLRQYAQYTVNIFSADGLPKQPSSRVQKFRKAVCVDKKKGFFCPLVCICVSDLKGKTSVQKSRTPVWNEALTFTDIFPPNWSFIRVQLMSYTTLGSTILAEHCIPLSSISHLSTTEVNNFPPTFGPAYVHVYTEDGAYAGRILLGITTKILDEIVSIPVREIKLTTCEPCPELEGSVELVLFTSFLEVSMLSSELENHKITLEVCFGSPFVPQGNVATSVPIIATKGDEGLCFLPIAEICPCVHIVGSWLNRRSRMFISNRLMNIVKLMNAVIHNKVTRTTIKSTLINVADRCNRILSNLQNKYKLSNTENTTKLDNLNMVVCKSYLAEIVAKCKESVEKGSMNEQILLMKEFITGLKNLARDPQQGGMPNICVRLLTDNGCLVAEYHIEPESILYSHNSDEIGINCCQPFTIYMQTRNSAESWETALVAKLRLYMWLGLHREIPACLKNLCLMCSKLYDFGKLLPDSIQLAQKQIFECRAHIYQGSFITGWDKSGLCDPYIRVTIGNRSCCTKVMNETLSPIWNETLVLGPLILWGSLENIASNPPSVVVEAFDQDVGNSAYIGRIVNIPTVQLLSSQQVINQNPSFEWFVMKRSGTVVANILAAFELIQQISEVASPIPTYSMFPAMSRYKLECFFWGLRGNTRIESPSIRIECSGYEICSSIIRNMNKHSNFRNSQQWIEMILPEEPSYLPPFTIKLFNHRNLCKPYYEGACMVPSLQPFLQQLKRHNRPTLKIDLIKCECQSRLMGPALSSTTNTFTTTNSNDELNIGDSETTPLLTESSYISKLNTEHNNTLQSQLQGLQSENVQLDWWHKLFASQNKTIYDRELEAQPEFNGFKDLVQRFSLVKGHRCMDQNPPEIAIFKGSFNLLRLQEEQNAESLPFTLKPPYSLKSEEGCSTRVLARLYIVKGRRLRPKDIDGLSDPYITISTNLGQRIRDRDNYIQGDLNPTFGKYFELVLDVPQEHELVIGVLDRDDSSCDDLIGETRIDIESRLMTRHRAHCGISTRFDKSGYNMWRDGEQPSQILQFLCKQYSIPLPVLQGQQLTVGSLVVCGPVDVSLEELSLTVLHMWEKVAGWSLVPEHIETRPLFLPRRPGVEQGRLLMWLDLFPQHGPAPNPPVDISPRTPVSYELRVIVWNAEEVTLSDTSILNEKMSDIFFKCWIGEEKHHQCTDIHYRSLTGEGQFNWRMLFPFSYWPAQSRMIIKKKIIAGMFARGEQLLPCILTVQVWDADLISSDDFLGSTSLELCCLHPGAKSAQKCTLKNVEVSSYNLFVMKRTRGWWPLKNKKGELAGKVELELEILKAEEALTHPVGLGRNPPEPLPIPRRTDSSFLWLFNPARATKIILWQRYKKKILCVCVCLLLLMPVFLTILLFPIIFVNKLFNF